MFTFQNVLQSIVKIIIIGIIHSAANVDGNPQFYPPPLPYYQNENYFIPGFVPPYHDPPQVYFREQHAPPPISFHRMNSFSPPQLFHQNENYNPAQLTHPSLRYSMLQYKHNPVQPFNQVQNDNYERPTADYKEPPMETPLKKQGFYASGIIIKDEGHPAFYQEDFSKNHNDEDYADNYSDEAPPPPEPCLLNSPYRYFEPKENVPSKYTLCNPNLGNGIYTVKMPITLLPSRFPPRVEQFIERIQNYFSTYTEQETPKPQNETSPTTAAITAMEATTESITHTTVMNTTDNKKGNITTEIQELGLVETNPEPSVAAAAGETATPTVTVTTATSTIAPVHEEVTQKTIVVEVEPQEEEVTDNGEIVEAHIAKQSQVAVETLNELTENTVSSTQSSANHRGEETTRQTAPKVDSTTQVQYENENSSENQISNELSPSENPPAAPVTADAKDATSVGPQTWSKADDASTVLPTSEALIDVTDKNG